MANPYLQSVQASKPSGTQQFQTAISNPYIKSVAPQVQVSEPQQKPSFIETARPIIKNVFEQGKSFIKSAPGFIRGVKEDFKREPESFTVGASVAGTKLISGIGNVEGKIINGIASILGKQVPERWDLSKQAKAFEQLNKINVEPYKENKAFQVGETYGHLVKFAFEWEIARGTVGKVIELPAAKLFGPKLAFLAPKVATIATGAGLGQLEYDKENDGTRVDRLKSDITIFGLFEAAPILAKGISKATSKLVSKTYNEVSSKIKSGKPVEITALEKITQPAKEAIEKETGKNPQSLFINNVSKTGEKELEFVSIPKAEVVAMVKSESMKKIPKELEPLAQEARKYKSVEDFVEDYGKTTREVSLGKPVYGALGEFTSEKKIKIKSTGLSKGEIKEVIAHEQRHSVTDKVMGYFLTKGEKGFDKELSRVEREIGKMPMTVGIKTEGEIDAQILEHFTYNNKEFAKRLPELNKYLIDYFNLRKQARTIPNLTDFYNQSLGGVKGEVKPKEVSVPREQLPVSSPEGKVKASRLEERITASLKNIPEETKQALGETKITGMTNKDQIRKASEYVINNTEEAMAVIKGEKPAPKGLLDNSIFVALHNLAKDDTGLARRIASLKSSRFGQEIEILKEIDPNSPVKIMSDIVKVRAEAFTKRYGGRSAKEVSEKVIGDIRKKVKAPDKYDWGRFVESIKC